MGGDGVRGGSSAGAALAGIAGDSVGVHGAFAIAGAGGLVALLVIAAGRLGRGAR